MPGLIVYASKYGSTREYALLLAQKLHTEALRASQVHLGALTRADFIILGSPIYAYSVLPEMESFVAKYGKILSVKPVAAFVVCGDTMWNPKSGEGGSRNLEKITRLLPSEPFNTMILGGRMRMEELDAEDGPRIRAFYDRLGRDPAGFDRMEVEKVGPWVEEIRKVLKRGEQ
jgi:menaquinone-dependent protoporphyrinogen oxidase